MDWWIKAFFIAKVPYSHTRYCCVSGTFSRRRFLKNRVKVVDKRQELNEGERERGSCDELRL